MGVTREVTPRDEEEDVGVAPLSPRRRDKGVCTGYGAGVGKSDGETGKRAPREWSNEESSAEGCFQNTAE